MPCHAQVLDHHGAPEVMHWREVDLPAPEPGEVTLRQAYAGVNFIDVYCRTGAYPLIDPPGVPGMEGAGVIEALGEGVTGLRVGDRVAYGTGPVGGYATARNLPAERLVKLPDAIGLDAAAAMMLKGLTAEYLLHRSWKVEAGQTILVHAASGGMGSWLVPWAKALGATVIGTVGDADKARRAEALGCDRVVNYRSEDFVAAVEDFTGGAGVRVAYDGVGKSTLPGSLECLGILGRLVTFGNASGKPDPVDTAALGAKSLSIIRPSLFHYASTPEALQEMAGNLFHAVEQGWVDPTPAHVYALSEAVQAHRDLEGRKTSGTIVLEA